MLLSKAIPVLALPILAAAIPNNPTVTTVTVTQTVTTTQVVTETAVSQCNTGPIQCCDSVGTAGSSNIITGLLSLLGVVVNALVPIGVNCSPATILGGGSTSW